MVFHKGYCEFAAAAITGEPAAFQAAAADFDKALEAWPARAAALAKRKQPAEPAPSVLRVLAQVARLKAGTEEPALDAAARELVSALALPACPAALMPAGLVPVPQRHRPPVAGLDRAPWRRSGNRRRRLRRRLRPRLVRLGLRAPGVPRPPIPASRGCLSARRFGLGRRAPPIAPAARRSHRTAPRSFLGLHRSRRRPPAGRRPRRGHCRAQPGCSGIALQFPRPLPSRPRRRRRRPKRSRPRRLQPGQPHRFCQRQRPGLRRSAPVSRHPALPPQAVPRRRRRILQRAEFLHRRIPARRRRGLAAPLRRGRRQLRCRHPLPGRGPALRLALFPPPGSTLFHVRLPRPVIPV